METLSSNPHLTTAGLIFGAIGTFSGIALSSAIASTAFAYRIAAGTWAAITGVVVAATDFDQ